MVSRGVLPILNSILLAPLLLEGAETAGWRGNWTGLWPDARPPLEWRRIPHGPMEGLRARADPPPGPSDIGGAEVEKGLLRDWLSIGPFPVADSVKDFDREVIPGEADSHPSPGDRVGEAAWKPLSMPPPDRWAFGEAELDWIDLTKSFEFRENQVAYVHTYLRAARAGPVRAVVDHGFGLKAWLNGKAVYAGPRRDMGLGSYVALSRMETDLVRTRSPSFDLDLLEGWNRLALKVTSANREGFEEMKFCLRLMDVPSVPYESKDILWMAELPGRSNATPIIAGGRIFVMAEPDELICLSRDGGKVLWSASNDYLEATPREEREAIPAFKEKVEPLAAELRREKDPGKRVEVRRKLQEALEGIDRKRYAHRLDGHLAGHFGIVGFTTPTPASDGEAVYVWCGNGVAASYGIDGRRRWISRVSADKLYYASSPALIGGRFVVYMKELIALDARTGAVVWRQPEVDKNSAAVLPARIAGTDVIVSQQGEVVRASDGAMLFRQKGKVSGDSGWCAPVVIGDAVHLPFYGITTLYRYDFSKAGGDAWEPRTTEVHDIAVSRKPDGSWVDRWMAASPLVHDGLAYGADIYSTFYAVDLEEKKTLYRQDLDFRGLFHYNAVPVAASPALIGDRILVMDNQGTTLVLEPGREFKQVRKNRIATQLERPWPIPAQETIGYAPPVPDGNRLYIRGERYLYCIGEE